MRAPAAAALLGAAAAVAAAADPEPARLNGREVRAGTAVSLRSGDRFEAGGAPAEATTPAGRVTLAPGSVLTHQGAEGAAEYLFVASGRAEGDVGPGSVLGTAAGWVLPSDGGPQPASARVRVGAPAGSTGGASSFRVLSGRASIRFHAVSLLVAAGCEVALVPSEEGPGSLGFAAAAGNPGPVEVLRASGGLGHAVSVPAGASGVLADHGGATRIACRRAPRGALLRVEARRDGRVVAAGAAGPGAEVLLDADRLRARVPAVPDAVLEGLLRQEVEFAPLGNR